MVMTATVSTAGMRIMVTVTIAVATAVIASDTTGEMPATTGGLLIDIIDTTADTIVDTTVATGITVTVTAPDTANTALTAIPIMVAVTTTDIWP
jgi:hypothetical protein